MAYDYKYSGLNLLKTVVAKKIIMEIHIHKRTVKIQNKYFFLFVPQIYDLLCSTHCEYFNNRQILYKSCDKIWISRQNTIIIIFTLA